MSYTYARVGCELWGSQSIGECTQRQLDNIKSKRRVSADSPLVRRHQLHSINKYCIFLHFQTLYIPHYYSYMFACLGCPRTLN